MSKTTTYFAQYRTDHIARCIAERKPFDTSGNLSGRDSGYSGLWGWESHHPAWAARLREIALAPDVWRVEYTVYSFRTIIAVLVRDISSATLDPDAPQPVYWLVDAAARHHSGYTSRAVSTFLGAIDAPGYMSWHARQLGTMSSLFPDEIHRVHEIGRDWLVAQRLSPTQRRFLWADRGLPIPAPTRKVLLRENLLDERGFLTDFGLNVAQWCA